MVKRKLRDPLEDRKGSLFFDGFSVKELAEKYDTPLYVLSEKRIRDNYNRLYNALISNYKHLRVYYAAKANSNLTVLRILQSEGAYLDTVSPGEVFMGLSSGYTPDRILFTGTSVRNDELKFLAGANITINVDSQSELDRLLKIAVPQILSVRVNPEVGAGHHNHCITAGPESKFGLWEEETIQAYAIAKRARVERFGIHMHIGSGILELEPYVLAVEKLLSIAKRVHDEVGIDFEFMDIGGGFGVPYKPEDKDLDLTEFSTKVVAMFKNKVKEYGLGKPFLCVEPGRYLVCDASILLTTVNTVKVTPAKKVRRRRCRLQHFGSPNDVRFLPPNPSCQQACTSRQGNLRCGGSNLRVRRRLSQRPQRYQLVEEGDLLAVLNAGAYGFSMSSQYNSRPRAAEVMIRQGKAIVIRQARGTE